ncbi:MAG: DUF4143 domain-containing protein [candidate division KSB1 bacterium]|nr:DUF4143 domain-containing protein [candidate division KSB1 bacterium]
METAVGAHLVNSTVGSPIQVFYWRDRQFEVDFVLQKGERRIAIEVKSGARLPRKYTGIQAFKRQFPGSNSLVVGGDGVPLEEFFMMPAGTWFTQPF